MHILFIYNNQVLYLLVIFSWHVLAIWLPWKTIGGPQSSFAMYPKPNYEFLSHLLDVGYPIIKGNS